MVYGNQAELDWVYSHAAILVTVPTRERRDNDGKKASDSPVKQNLIDVATFWYGARQNLKQEYGLILISIGIARCARGK